MAWLTALEVRCSSAAAAATERTRAVASKARIPDRGRIEFIERQAPVVGSCEALDSSGIEMGQDRRPCVLLRRQQRLPPERDRLFRPWLLRRNIEPDSRIIANFAFAR